MGSRAPKPVSAGRPLAWRWRLPAAACGFLAGLIVGEAGGPHGVALLGAAVLLVPLVAHRHRALGAAGFFASVGVLVGLAEVAVVEVLRDDPRATIDETTPRRIEGIVLATREIVARPGVGGVRLELLLTAPATSRSGPRGDVGAGERVLLSVWRSTRRWRVGDRVATVAELRRPRGFCNRGVDAYAKAMARRGISALAKIGDDGALELQERPPRRGWWRLLEHAREATGAAIEASGPAAETSILQALILGDQSRIPAPLREAYSRTGTTHVLSVSGLHIAIVAGFAFRLLSWVLAWTPLARNLVVARIAAAVAVVPASLYAVFAGGSIATQRSLVMGAAFLAAVVLQRRPDIFTALALAAIAVGLGDPVAPFDASFQLTFAAVLSIVVGATRLGETRIGAVLGGERRPGVRSRLRLAVAGAVSVSIVAALGTAPITAAHFGVISVAGIVGNLAVIPLVGWGALFGGLFGTTLLPVAPVLAEVCFAAGGWAVAAANAFVLALAEVPGAAVEVHPPSPGVAALWSCVVAALALRKERRRWSYALGALILAMTVGMVERSVGRGGLRVAFLDVGQGDAALVELPREGGVVLVDGGGVAGRIDTGLQVLIPALRDRGADVVRAIALSHPQFDHLGGLASVVERVRVDEFWSNGRRRDTSSFARLDQTLDRKGVRRRVLREGDEVGDFAGVDVEVLHPRRSGGGMTENDASLVLGIRFGATRVLFSGDIESGAERSLLIAGGDVAADVIKVPHHGSRTSSTESFVHVVRPAIAVAGTGDHNRFGFPAREVRDRYARLGAAWFETARHGGVDVESDGQLVRVRSCRESRAE